MSASNRPCGPATTIVRRESGLYILERYCQFSHIKPHSAIFGLRNRWAGEQPRYAAFAYQGIDLQSDASGLPREGLYGSEPLKGQRPAQTIDA